MQRAYAFLILFHRAVVYPAGLIRGVCSIPGNLLNDETYSVMIMIVKDMSVRLFLKTMSLYLK